MQPHTSRNKSALLGELNMLATIGQLVRGHDGSSTSDEDLSFEVYQCAL